MNFKNKKIAVLMGGLSKEREISLRSGQAVATALKARGYHVESIDVGERVAEVLVAKKIETAFIALHGRYGEDGCIQGLLEILKIPYTGSGVLASAVCMDKSLTKKLALQEGIQTPAWEVLEKDLEAAIKKTSLPLPVIVKPSREGSTIGVTIVRQEKDFLPAVHEAFRYDHSILVESFITGAEVTVGIVQGKVLPVLEIAPKSGFYDFTSKYTKGLTDYILPARIPEMIQKILRDATQKFYDKLGLSGFARMDYMVDARGEAYFLEVNTVPGMTETSLVPKAAAFVGISFEDLCEEVLKGASLKS